MTSTTRNHEISQIHIKYADFYPIAGGLTLVVIGILIGAWVFGQNRFALPENMLGYVTNVSTELLSVFATILVIDQLNRRQAKRERQLALFRQVKSRSNDVAVEALDQIMHEGWWKDMLEHYQDEDGWINLHSIRWAGGVYLEEVNLQYATLVNANLQHADLRKANLQYATLVSANLQHANLRKANLQYATLVSANLQHADLWEGNLQLANLDEVNLQLANLWEANLQYATLVSANLQHADLSGANLQNANLVNTNLKYTSLVNTNLKHTNLMNTNLQSANLIESNLQHTNLIETSLRDAKNIETALFDERTVLPDGVEWKPETDMTRYTDPNHPDFWEPEWVKNQRNES